MRGNRAIDCFSTYLDERGMQRSTVAIYRADLSTLKEWMITRHSWPISESDPAKITQWVSYRKYLLGRFMPATVNRKLTVTRRFLRWLSGGETSPTLQVLRGVQIKRKTRELSFTDQSVQSLIDKLEEKGDVTEKTIIRLLRETGMRISEVCDLRWRDVVIGETTSLLSIREQKSGRVRQVPLDRELVLLFIELGYEENQQAEHLIFPNITRRRVQSLVGRYTKEARVFANARILRDQFHQNLLHQLSAEDATRTARGIRSRKSAEHHPPSQGVGLNALLPSGGGKDSFQDLYFVDPSLMRIEDIRSIVVLKSNRERSAAVRRAILIRARGVCERCGFKAPNQSLLEVHHIVLSNEPDDLFANCVALCPNCHRLCHCLPGCVEIERQLLEFARRFGPNAPAGVLPAISISHIAPTSAVGAGSGEVTAQTYASEPKETENARPDFEGKLTKQILMRLPTGCCLISNVAYDLSTPVLEVMLGPPQTREELWRRICELKVNGRTVKGFSDPESLRREKESRRRASQGAGNVR